MKKLMRCTSCGAYTLSSSHCGVAVASAHPPLFNPNDPYGEYRRKIKGIGAD
ncbi:MAG: nucleolar RNA-binding Nop10p family protein [Candidatus Micrarchaeota archaeon]